MKKVKKTVKKIAKKVIPKKTKKKAAPKAMVSQIKRPGYALYFVNPKDETKLNELRNSGKGIGEITITDATPGNAFDEVIVAIRD